MSEISKVLNMKGLRMIMLDENHLQDLTLANVKAVLEGTAAVDEIRRLEQYREGVVLTAHWPSDFVILEQTDMIAKELMERQGLQLEDYGIRSWNMRDNGARAAVEFACWVVEKVTGIDAKELIPMTAEEGE